MTAQARTARVTAAAVLTTAVVLAIVGCSGQDVENAPTEGAADVNRDATLTFGFNEPPTSLDPYAGTSAQDLPWLLPAYDTLLHYNPDGTLAPGLAESWDLTDTEFTVQLRPDLTFHDGTDLNADAVVANFERAKTLPTSAIQSDIASVESAEAVDDLTVVYQLAGPDASVPATFGDRAGMMISPAAFDDGTNLATTMVGAGGWEVSNYSPGDELTVTRYHDYWDPDAVEVETLVIRTIADDDTRLNALRSGEIDMARLVPGQVTLAEADSSLTVQTDTPIAVDHLGLNIAIAPFDDPQVRMAIEYAIDREAIVEGVYRGIGTVAWQPFPRSDYFAFDPELEEMYPYDPERARELLADAGYPDGFSFDFYTNNQPFRVQATEAIAAMLADVGIQGNIIPLDGPTLLDEFYYQKTVPMYFTPWGGPRRSVDHPR
ncbi:MULTISPECIES: ABC transporter substrate-binding protein [unclassified Microbacterium]|uniref:ABC transporter substrate-binding protein n=1 Tax=unclassified Microbacterium TaxID=2609290 RepID=UPI0025EA0B43|nr:MULTISPECIES: ABC transporter substrate-binding protein [unclassified Microbacterium]